MRKRLVIAAVCILALPLFFSASQSDLTNPGPYATVVLAGHTTAGNWCDCGTPGCLCDPGEQGGNRATPVSDQNGRSLNQGSTSASARVAFAFDLGSGALMLALAFFLWARFRA